jgi:hypothetical protein
MLMKRFLLAKSWQLFLAVFVVPFSIFISGLFVPLHVLNGAYFFFAIPIAVVLSQMVIYSWMWSVGHILFKALNLSLFFTNGTFRFFIAIPVAIIFLILIFWLWGATILGLGQFSMANILTGMLVFVVPLEILFMASQFYCFYFVAKVIKTAETDKVVSFENFSTEFIWLILFPVGIWFIQPRVNRVVAKGSKINIEA